MLLPNSFVRAFLLCVVLSSSACSTFFGERGVFRGKSQDYLDAGTLKPMQLPESTVTRPIQSLYSIPQVQPLDEFGEPLLLGDYEVPRPQPINTEKGSVGVKLQTLGDEKWIFLNASTAQVWPRTQNFLSEYGIDVVASDPAQGVIETGNVLFKSQPDLKSRFKIFIQKGMHPDTTEVHLLQMHFAADQPPATVVWPEASMNVDTERLLLDELARVLAQNVSNNSASLLGQNVGGPLKVQFLRGSAEATMRLRLIKERARATLAHSLEKEGFITWEEKSIGDHVLFYAGYDASSGEDRGFFRRILQRSLPKKAPNRIDDLLQTLSPEAEVQRRLSSLAGTDFQHSTAAMPPGYLVIMQHLPAGHSDVVIRNPRGEMIRGDEAKTLLRLIRKNLI